MRKLLYKGKFLSLHCSDGWEFVDRPQSAGVVCVVAVHEGRILLVEQFRHSQGRKVVSLPSGIVERRRGRRFGETPKAAARRELLEETGFQAKYMIEFASGPVCPGTSTENVTMFLARDLRKVQTPVGDGDEIIDVHLVPLTKLENWLKSMQKKGVMVDLKLRMGLLMLSSRPSNFWEGGK
jgi:ADP-ribose pyrophosphatase